MISIVHLFRSTQNLTLHPLIHTFTLGTSTLNVASSLKRQKCGLKYVMRTFRRLVRILHTNN
jgi:hypothetical protein